VNMADNSEGVRPSYDVPLKKLPPPTATIKSLLPRCAFPGPEKPPFGCPEVSLHSEPIPESGLNPFPHRPRFPMSLSIPDISLTLLHNPPPHLDLPLRPSAPAPYPRHPVDDGMANGVGDGAGTWDQGWGRAGGCGICAPIGGARTWLVGGGEKRSGSLGVEWRRRRTGGDGVRGSHTPVP
jgi:hypothetical protein